MKGYVDSIKFPNNKRYIGITVRNQHVSAVLRGKQKQTKGYSFEYI